MRKITLTFFSDPGHGWVKVKKTLLGALNIEKEISCYSYMRGEFAYLEEDCDAPKLTNALKQNGIEIKIVEKFAKQRESKIRSYARYSPPRTFHDIFEIIQVTGK